MFYCYVQLGVGIGFGILFVKGYGVQVNFIYFKVSMGNGFVMYVFVSVGFNELVFV